MTCDEIERLRKLCEKATPGPWEASHVCDPGCCPRGWMVQKDGEDIIFGTRNTKGDDVSFIAAARESLPRLLDEVERLQNEVAHLRGCTWRCLGCLSWNKYGDQCKCGNYP